AYLNVNDAVKLLIHSDPSIIDNASDDVIRIKHNMDGTTIGASTNFLMSTISCVESGINKQSATNVILLGQFKFNKENRSEIERVIPDEFIDMMEKKLVCLKNLKLELDFISASILKDDCFDILQNVQKQLCHNIENV
ncbi:unnamed protein product, partial [Didymodactylos carnosus]